MGERGCARWVVTALGFFFTVDPLGLVEWHVHERNCVMRVRNLDMEH